MLDGRVSFQAILFEGSNDIAFQYKTLEGPRSYGESATVGLQNAARTLAAQFSFNQARLYPGRVVVFRFNPSNATYERKRQRGEAVHSARHRHGEVSHESGTHQRFGRSDSGHVDAVCCQRIRDRVENRRRCPLVACFS